MEFPDEFINVQEFLNEINRINRGGCGIAAYVMGKILEKYDFTFSIVFCDDDEYDNRTNKEYLEGKSKRIAIPSHIVLYLPSYGHLDTTGKYWISEYYKLEGFTLDDLELAIKSEGWNPEFDRSMYIPVIERYTGIDLRFALQ